MVPGSPDETEADRALRRALIFVRRQALVSWEAITPSPSDGARLRRRVAANWMSELDRLFGVCLDGGRLGRVATRYAVTMPNPQRTGAVERLRALKRTREALYFTDGVVRRADRRGGQLMSLGWYGDRGPSLMQIAIGDRISLRSRDLDDVCSFYEQIAAARSHRSE